MAKKLVVLSLLLSMLVVVSGVACAKAPASPAAGSKPATAGPSGELAKTMVTTSTATGASYIYNTAIGNILNKYSPIKTSNTIHAGAIQKFQAMMSGEADITPISASVPGRIFRGQEGAELQKAIQLRSLFCGGGLAASFNGVFALPNKGINSIKDIKGKRWYAEQKPSPQFAVISDAVIKANGMTRSDFKWLSIAAPPDGFKDLKEGRVDAYTGVMGAGTTEMAQTTGLLVVPLTRAEQEECNRADPAFNPGTVPKGTLGAPADTPSLISPTVWWVTPRMSDITAYTILKTVYDNYDEFAASHPSCTGFTLKDGVSVWAIPYHTGAIYYFKEKGLWGAEQEKKQQELLKLEKAAPAR